MIWLLKVHLAPPSPMFHSIWTILVMVIFIGIVIWAYSGRRKKAFDEAAQLPFADEAAHRNTVQQTAAKGENPND